MATDTRKLNEEFANRVLSENPLKEVDDARSLDSLMVDVERRLDDQYWDLHTKLNGAYDSGQEQLADRVKLGRIAIALKHARDARHQVMGLGILT